MRDMKMPFFSAGVAARLVGVAPATLRRWESHGMLGGRRRTTPHSGRTAGRYSWRDIDAFQRIAFAMGEQASCFAHSGPTVSRPKRRVVAVERVRTARRKSA